MPRPALKLVAPAKAPPPAPPKPKPHDPAHRGYVVAYRTGETNHCPGCGHTHWYVGRLTAECGFCGTALPLAGAGEFGRDCYLECGRG